MTLKNLAGEEFGSKKELFSSKKSARHNAARRAIQYYKAKGDWPDDVNDVGGIKKRKPQPTPGSNSVVSSSAKDGPSYAQRVAQLSTALSLGPPEWRYKAGTSSEFHTVECFFKEDDEHRGPHGKVRDICGKKAAKEACAKKVLVYLEELQAERLSALPQAMRAQAAHTEAGAEEDLRQYFNFGASSGGGGGGGITLGAGLAVCADPGDSSDEGEYDSAEENLKGDV